jgi:hypothetical protein
MAVLAALPLLSFAQDKPFVTPLLPAANWQQADSHSLPLSEVANYGGDPAIEREYGVKALDLRTYTLGKRQVQVVVEPAPDPTSSYGLLTFYATPYMKQPKGIQLTFGDANQFLMARGVNFIRFLRSKSAVSDNEYRALLIFVGGTKPSERTMEVLPRPLPEKGLVPGTEKYLLGMEAAKRVLPAFRTDLIGFDQGAEVQLGQYQEGKGTSTLISIGYPTPHIARTRFGSMSSLLGLNRDQAGDVTYGKRDGSYVFLVLNAPNKDSASTLLDQLKLTTNVTWDQKYNSERTFTLDLIHMILAIILLCFILVGVCAVGGVLFFLSKRFAAKFFPTSQWARSQDEQLIRLNLK